MSWKNIRLELAGTESFPQGSASRAYLLRLPLDPAGLIDPGALASNPAKATVRRFWASEPDLHGHVVPNSCGWLFRCDGGRMPESVMHFAPQALIENRKVMVREADGTFLPYRVASVTDLRQAACNAK